MSLQQEEALLIEENQASATSDDLSGQITEINSKINSLNILVDDQQLILQKLDAQYVHDSKLAINQFENNLL